MKKRMTWVALVMVLVMVVAQGAWASEMEPPPNGCDTHECECTMCVSVCSCGPGNACGPDCSYYVDPTEETSTGTQGGATFVATETGNAPSVYRALANTFGYKDPANRETGKVSISAGTTFTVTMNTNIDGVTYAFATVDGVGLYIEFASLGLVVDAVSPSEEDTVIIWGLQEGQAGKQAGYYNNYNGIGRNGSDRR